MEGKPRTRAGRARAVGLVAVGLVIGTTMMATPAAGHVGGTVGHLVGHLKKTFYTKAQSNTRFVNVGEKATASAHADTAGSATNAQNAENAQNATNAQNAQNSDKLDGIDSSGFVQSSGTSRVLTVRRNFSGVGAVGANSETQLTLPNLGTIVLICGGNPSPVGSVRFNNTSGTGIDSFVDDSSAGFSQTNVPTATSHTIDMGSAAKRIVWQLSQGPDYFGSPNMATIVISHYAVNPQCRFTAQAILGDPFPTVN